MSSKKNKAQARADRAAELLVEQQKAERARQLKVVLGVVVMVLVIIGVGFGINKFTGSKDETPNRLGAVASAGEFGVAIGDEDAPTTVVIYEDFLCPFCGQLEAATRDRLTEAAESGDAFVEYRPFNLFTDNEYSVASANAFKVVQEEAGNAEAKEFHDLLFENQPPESGPYPDNDQLIAWAVEAGADEAAVRDGIENLSQRAWVEQATKSAADAKIESTPTVFVNDRLVEGRTLDDVVNAIFDEL